MSKKQFYSKQYKPDLPEHHQAKDTGGLGELRTKLGIAASPCIATFNRQPVSPLSMHAADGNLGRRKIAAKRDLVLA